MLCAGTASLYKTIKPQGRTFFRRSHLTANLPVTVAGRVRQQKALIHSQRLMQPQCTAVVDNPLTAGVESNGTGGYQHKYKELNTGDSLAIEYADDTAAAPKNRRAGDVQYKAPLVAVTLSLGNLCVVANLQTISDAAQHCVTVSRCHSASNIPARPIRNRRDRQRSLQVC